MTEAITDDTRTSQALVRGGRVPSSGDRIRELG